VGVLAKLFGATSREELKGIALGREVAWEVPPVRDFPSLLRALPILVLNAGFAPPPEEVW
jgi:hypothetical protein